MSLETVLFGNKKFSDLLKDIYDNQKKKDRSITLLIADLKPMIQSTSDAAVLVPIIKDYMEIAIRNDEQLVKLAAVVQRIITNKGEEGSSFLTDEEKEELLRNIEEVGNSIDKLEVKSNNVTGSTENNT